MHEVGIVQSILEVAAQQTRAADATCIHVIRLRIGRLTGVVPEAIEHAFTVLRAGTPAAGALKSVSSQNARRLAMMADDGSLASLAISASFHFQFQPAPGN